MVKELSESRFTVNGKSTFKEEFVTAGGVDTIEVNFTTMESRKFNGLYLAGEVINIDALTGGFNFQAAWTEAYIGDWISMPKFGADGNVLEINLTTVKVQNWDKTIINIPTYSLISDSFQNWRRLCDGNRQRHRGFGHAAFR